MNQAIIYCRVSTEDQASEGVSLDMQAAKGRAWAELNGYSVAAIYTDAGISGKRADNRPELQRALADLGRGDALVIYSLSRLSRSTRDTLALADRLERTGADLVSLSEKIDTTSAAGKMIFRLLSVLNEFERDQIVERVTGAMQHLKATGKAYNHEPFGFDRRGDRFIRNEREQATIADMLTWRANGYTLQAIADRLTADGVKAKRGGKWQPAQVRDIIQRASLAVAA